MSKQAELLPEKREEQRALTPMDLLQSAQSKGADIDQLQKLMELQLRWEENEARKAYNRAIAAFKAENIKIVKDAVVDFTSQKGRTHYRHATLANVVSQVTEAMCRHGLSHSWDTAHRDGLITVTCIVSHVEGHSEKVSLSAAPDNSGSKNSIQQIASTVTYLERYTLLSKLGLATHDDDGLGEETSGPITEKQATEIEQLMAEAKVNEGRFFEFFGIKSLSELPASRYEEAKAMIKAKKGGK